MKQCFPRIDKRGLWHEIVNNTQNYIDGNRPIYNMEKQQTV